MLPEDAFLRSFESLEYPLADFGHEAHVYLAWCYLRRHPLPEAMVLYRDNLKRFAAHHGASAIYHETITMIYLLLIHDRIREGEAWEEFRERSPDLIAGGRETIARLYEAGALESANARARFSLPERWRRAFEA